MAAQVGGHAGSRRAVRRYGDGRNSIAFDGLRGGRRGARAQAVAPPFPPHGCDEICAATERWQRLDREAVVRAGRLVDGLLRTGRLHGDWARPRRSV